MYLQKPHNDHQATKRPDSNRTEAAKILSRQKRTQRQIIERLGFRA